MAASEDFFIKIKADIEDFKRGMAEVSNTIQSAGKNVASVGKGITAGVTLPIVGIAAAATNTAMDFEAQMSRVGAIAGATAGEMDLLRKSALDLGASTSKSAGEVAIAQEGLAAMGFTVQEVLGAMPGVISAAEASGSDMAQTAEVMASTLNVFGLEASEANRVADVLAQTANQSAASMTDMQYALKYAGGPANALGISLEELSASVGVMTDAGLKGENAGTALRGGLLGLLDPSEKNAKMMTAMGVAMTDSEGNFIGISKMVQNLDGAMAGMTDTQKAANLSQLVGKEAVTGFLALMEAGPEKIDSMTASLENSGGASQKAAGIMKDNLKGAVEEMSGAMETAAISIGTALTPMLRQAAEFISKLVEKFNEASPAQQKMVLIMAALAAVIGPVVIFVGMLMSALAAIMPILGAIAGAFGLLISPIGLLVVAIIGISIVIYKYWDEIKAFTISIFTGIGNFLKEWGTTLLIIMGGPLVWVIALFVKYFDQIKAFTIKVFTGIIEFFKTWGLTILTVLGGPIVWLVAFFVKNFDAINTKVKEIFNGLIAFFKNFITTLTVGISTGFTAIKDGIVGFVSGIVETAKTMGTNIIDGIIGGIKARATAAVDAIRGVGESLLGGFKNILGIASPAKAFVKEAGWIGAGVAEGVMANAKAGVKAIQNFAGQLTGAFNPELAISGVEMGTALDNLKGQQASVVGTMQNEKTQTIILEGELAPLVTRVKTDVATEVQNMTSGGLI